MFEKAENNTTYQSLMNVIKVCKKVFIETKQINQEDKDGLLKEQSKSANPVENFGAGLAAHSAEFIKLQSFFT